MEELTKKQRAILDYMKAHVAEHTYWPSIRDIQAKFRFASTNAVFGHLQALERKGVLQRIPGAARAYKIVPEVLGDTSETVIRYEGPGDDAIAFESVKFAGSIAAGFPDYTESSGVLDSMQVPISASSRRRAPEAFALRVRGDSMIDADINDGDTVIIRKGDTAHNGDIIVALVDDEEATLKRLRRKGDSVALEAANPTYETRIFGPDRVRVQGRLVGLIRTY